MKRDEENWKRKRGGITSLVFVTQHTHVTSQSDPKKSNGSDETDVEPSSEPSRESQETKKVPPTEPDETDVAPRAPPWYEYPETKKYPTTIPVTRIPEAEKTPEGFYTQTYLPEQYHGTKAKLEVQSLLRMLQNSPF